MMQFSPIAPSTLLVGPTKPKPPQLIFQSLSSSSSVYPSPRSAPCDENNLLDEKHSAEEFWNSSVDKENISISTPPPILAPNPVRPPLRVVTRVTSPPTISRRRSSTSSFLSLSLSGIEPKQPLPVYAPTEQTRRQSVEKFESTFLQSTAYPISPDSAGPPAARRPSLVTFFQSISSRNSSQRYSRSRTSTGSSLEDPQVDDLFDSITELHSRISCDFDLSPVVGKTVFGSPEIQVTLPPKIAEFDLEEDDEGDDHFDQQI